MDMFKLLTRSTNIQKSAPASKKTSNHIIPSAGYTDNFQTYSENSDTFDTQTDSCHRGAKRKRKRNEAGGGNGDNVPTVLDFFGSAVRPAVSLGKPVESVSDLSSGKPSKVHAAHCINNAILDLDEVECRRILKKNKLKATILGDAQATKDERKGKTKKSPSADHNSKKGIHAQIPLQPLTSFSQLRSKYGISRRLAGNLEAQGYTAPTEVQIGSLPLLLGSNKDRGLDLRGDEKANKDSNSDIDLLTVAPTGSGKTLCFMIHVLHGLLKSRQADGKVTPIQKPKHRVQGLVIAPTHELADQIVNEGKKLALGTGMKVTGLKKGMRLHSNLLDTDVNKYDISREDDDGETEGEHVSASKSLVKADVVVSTPLLLLHAISGGDSIPVPLPEVRFLVLDEADVLLDTLFREQTLGIWTACTNSTLQTSLWSATIGSSVESLAQTFILDRRRNLGLTSSSPAFQHFVIRLVVGLKDSAIPNISHRLIYAASEQGKLLGLRQLLHPSGAPAGDAPSLQPPFLIFTQTISRAVALHSELVYDIPIEAGGSSRIAVLHADLSDTARSNIMAGFRKAEIWILITTDLLSRGVDFRGMNGVVNYDIPNTGASYVHRVGRTGRQGREGGVAVTFYTKEDIPYVKNVVNVIAASEKAKNKTGLAHNDGDGMQRWLLDALPNVSKKTRNELKRKGVESRRANVEGEGRGASKMRISTKSGYDRRLENRKKGAVAGSRKISAQKDIGEADGEWEGFDD